MKTTAGIELFCPFIHSTPTNCCKNVIICSGFHHRRISLNSGSSWSTPSKTTSQTASSLIQVLYL